MNDKSGTLLGTKSAGEERRELEPPAYRLQCHALSRIGKGYIATGIILYS